MGKSGHPQRRFYWISKVAAILIIFVASISIQAQTSITMPDFGALRLSFDSRDSKGKSKDGLLNSLDWTLPWESEPSARNLFGALESLHKPYNARDRFLREYERDLHFYGPRPKRTYRNPEFWRSLSLAPYPGYILNIAAEGRRRIAQGQNRNR